MEINYPVPSDKNYNGDYRDNIYVKELQSQQNTIHLFNRKFIWMGNPRF